MRFSLLTAALPLYLITLGACSSEEAGEKGEAREARPEAAVDGGADSMAARDPGPGSTVDTSIPDVESRPLMQAQVVLERLDSWK